MTHLAMEGMIAVASFVVAILPWRVKSLRRWTGWMLALAAAGFAAYGLGTGNRTLADWAGNVAGWITAVMLWRAFRKRR